jgi:uncharacterized protein YbjT (DUF2867 family)
MERDHGGPERWQAEATKQWISRLAAEVHDASVCILDGQTRPSFVRAALANVDAPHVQIVLLECSPATRSTRLAARGQAELATGRMDTWAAYLRGQADALELPVIDTTHLGVEKAADALEAQVQSFIAQVATNDAGMPLRAVMLGASGAVGQQVVAALQGTPALGKLTLLNRRPLVGVASGRTEQHVVDVLSPHTYEHLLGGHRAAVCTLGVGQPSAVSDAEFVRVDKDAVLAFARACKQAHVEHFELLSSVGADAGSRSFYLRSKGELCDALVALGFERLSLFQPSMILTPANRYGIAQGLALALWPKLDVVLRGSWRRYRGVAVETLGAAIAANLFTRGGGVERLSWHDFQVLAAPDEAPIGGSRPARG